MTEKLMTQQLKRKKKVEKRGRNKIRDQVL